MRISDWSSDVCSSDLGANGVLFRGTADGYGSGGVSVGAGGGRVGGSSFSGGGIGVNISPRQKNARGIAIYVANPAAVDETPPAPAPAPAPEPPRRATSPTGGQDRKSGGRGKRWSGRVVIGGGR